MPQWGEGVWLQDVAVAYVSMLCCCCCCRPFFPKLVKFLASGPVVAMVRLPHLCTLVVLLSALQQSGTASPR
jgi:hypothetical protein